MRLADSDKDKAAKLLTISCNYCNRKIHATMKQFVDGMECPGCGMPVTVGNDDSSTFNSFLHKTQCVNCHHEFDVSLPNSFKYMAVCPKCDALFVRKNLVIDDSSSDRESEAFRLMELLYPSMPNNLNSDLSDVAPASEQELSFLRDLNIKFNGPNSRTVRRLAKQIFDMVNVAILSNYNSVLFFDNHVRSQLYMAVAKSRLFRKIYFDQVVNREGLEPLLREELNDDELYRALCSDIDLAAFEIAVAYIGTFAKIIYEKDLDAKTARQLALRTFGRGFGHAIRNAGYFVYHHDENRVKSISKLSLPAMKSFYTQRNRVNDALHELFVSQNFAMPQQKGCLGLIVLSGGALFLLGRELIHYILT